MSKALLQLLHRLWKTSAGSRTSESDCALAEYDDESSAVDLRSQVLAATALLTVILLALLLGTLLLLLLHRHNAKIQNLKEASVNSSPVRTRSVSRALPSEINQSEQENLGYAHVDASVVNEAEPSNAPHPRQLQKYIELASAAAMPEHEQLDDQEHESDDQCSLAFSARGVHPQASSVAPPCGLLSLHYRHLQLQRDDEWYRHSSRACSAASHSAPTLRAESNSERYRHQQYLLQTHSDGDASMNHACDSAPSRLRMAWSSEASIA